MRLAATTAVLLLTGCGLGMMGRGGQELSAPSVSALTPQADGTESVTLTWADAAVTREYLAQATASAGGTWLTGSQALSDRELRLTFAPGFAQAMAGQGAYTITLTLPDQSGLHACPCCRHASHLVQVELTFDQQGAVATSNVTQTYR